MTDINRDGVTIFEPRGPIDGTSAKPFAERISGLINSGTHRGVIDFQHVRYVSSAGFRPLLVAAKLIDAAGGRLVLCGLSPRPLRLLEFHFQH
jgi:anti-anti-sigma factor